MAQATALPIEIGASHNRGVTIDVHPSDNSDVASLVRQAANNNNVDPDLAVNIAHQESRFNQNAVSPKGARGVMQLMPDTAKSLGVNPDNLHENINGGVAYIKQLQDKYGADRPDLIAAGYNAGPDAVDKHGGVPPYKETQDYVKNVVGDPSNFVTSELPHSIQLDAAFGLPAGSGSTGSSSSPAPISTASASLPPTADLDKAFGVNRGTTPAAKSNPQTQSPGVQAALNDQSSKTAVIDKALNDKFGAGTVDPNSHVNALIGSIDQGLTGNTLPLIGGALAGLHTGINNYLYKNFGIGSAPQYSMSDAFNAAKQLGSQQLDTAANAHPVLSAVGNTAGFLGSPILRGVGAASAPIRAALAAKATGRAALAGRALIGAAETGAAGAAAGAGQATSEGGSPSQIGQEAAISGGLSALGGGAGEALAPVLGKGAAALVGKDAHPAAHVAARVGVHALSGAAIGGGVGAASALITGQPIVRSAAGGAILGLGPGGAHGIKESPAIAPGAYSPEHAQLATEHLAKTVASNLDEAAEHFESSPHQTTAEAAGEHTSKLLGTATQSNSNSVGNLKTAVADRQNQTEVKKNLIAAVNKAVGGDVEPGNIIHGVADDIAKVTGIHPSEAEMNADNYIESKKRNSPLWQKVDANGLNAVSTPEHNALLHNEPVVRTALAQAQRDLGPEGSTTNPNFKPNENEKTAKNLTSEDISEYFKNGPVAGRNFNQIDPQEIADYHNSNVKSEEPETVPTQKAWILAERYLGRSVPRNTFGKVDYSNPRTVEIQNSQQDVNAVNKQHFEGLKEAKAESGETFSFERAKDLGNNLNTTKTSESPEAFTKRYETLSAPDKEATQHGYLEEFYRKLRNDPISTANEYSKDIHQNFQKTMFGEDGANAFQGALYKAKLAKAINNLSANGGAIEEKHLKELNNFVTDETERATQDKIFGKNKAEQLRAAITKQVELAKSGSEVTKFSINGAAEKDHDVMQAAGLGFASHGPKGFIKGAAAVSGVKAVTHVVNSIKQGRMTPEVQQALADKLAQSPQQTAQDIRDLKARKQNMPMSKSTIVPNVIKGAFRGLGYTIGHGAGNAFSGLDNNR